MKEHKIDSSEISVVVQGPVSKDTTAECLKSIRKHLKNAQIILSTWDGADFSGLDYDIAVTSPDPGAFACDVIDNSIPNNINRQIISTNRGLKEISRKYTVKLRSDFKLTSAGFIDYFGKFPQVDSKYAFFKEKIVACSVYSRNPRCKFSQLVMPYCPSDFFHFGLSEDIKKLFEMELITDDEDKLYFKLHPAKQAEQRYKEGLCRFMPEQYLWINTVKKYIKDIDCEHRDQITDKNTVLTEQTFAHNLVFASKKELGVDSFKYNLFTKGIPQNCFTHQDWLCLYRKYCLNQHSQFIGYLARIKAKCTKYKLLNMKILSGPKLKLKGLMHKKITKLEGIAKHAQKYDYISFDIFDTLLFRTVDPSWIPMHLTGLYAEMLLKPICPKINGQSFNQLRNKFVNDNNLKNIRAGLDPEYELSDILKKILLHYEIDQSLIPELVKKIVENEIQREINCLYLNPKTIKTLEKLKRDGKKLIALSDMYLPQEEIIKILEHFQIAQYFDEIRVSSRHKLVKHTGNAYKKLIEDRPDLNKKILHIGDNLISDALAPKAQGVSSIWLKDKLNEKRRTKICDFRLRRKNLYDYTAKLFPIKSYSKDKGLKSFIKEPFALDMNNFVFEMMIKTYAKGINVIYFLERDGNLFKDIFEKLLPNITLFSNMPEVKLELLNISRKDSACLINLNSIDTVINRANRVNKPKAFSCEHVIGCFGLKLEDFEDFAQREILKNDSSREFFNKIYDAQIKPLILKRREKVVAYLTEKGILNYKNIGLADIGWGGTTQRDIQNFLKNESPHSTCFGFYYATDTRIADLKDFSYGYQDGTKLFYGYSFIEFLIKEYFKTNQDKLLQIEEKPFLKKTYETNDFSRKTIVDFGEKFSKIVNEHCLLPNDISDYSKTIIRNVMQHPPFNLTKDMDDILFSLDRKIGDEYMPIVPLLKNRAAHEPLYKKAQWVQASLVRSGFMQKNPPAPDKFKLLYSFYHFIDKIKYSTNTLKKRMKYRF